MARDWLQGVGAYALIQPGKYLQECPGVDCVDRVSMRGVAMECQVVDIVLRLEPTALVVA